MKKVAFISDIHSNFPALKAVLEDIEKRDIDNIFCLGDITGYHTMPNETISLIKERDILCIKGNHDNDILNKKFNPKKTPDIFSWTWNELTDENRSFLSSLPEQMKLEIDGHLLLLCHASPESIEEYCYEGTEYSEKMANSIEEDILICGHTHYPYLRQYGEKTLINTGSIGKPKIGRPNATWIEMIFDDKSIDCEIKEISYPFEVIAAHVEERGFIKYAEVLRTGIV